MGPLLFVYRKMDVGGCQLLIVKLALEAARSGSGAAVLCETMSDEIRRSLDGSDVGLQLMGEAAWPSDEAFRSRLRAMPGARIVCFQWLDYSRVYSLKAAEQSLLLYAVHRDTLKMIAFSSFAPLRLARMLLLRSAVRRLIGAGNAVAIDEQTVRQTESYYGFPAKELGIVRIPVDHEPDDCDAETAAGKFSDPVRNILAVARAEFPFKGYMLGLVEMLRDGRLPPNFRLVFVAYGPDCSRLEEAVAELPPEKRDRVTLIGKTPYSRLRDVFDRCHIFVGMGTSVLDAARYGVISVPVVPYTEKVLCRDFFHEHPNAVALDDGTEEAFLGLLDRLERFSPAELREVTARCSQIIAKMYSPAAAVAGIEAAFDERRPFGDLRIVIDYRLRRIKEKIQASMRG